MITATAKIKRIHALLANTGLMHSKHDILHHSYGVESTTQLTLEQMDHFIDRLQSLQGKRKQASDDIRRARSVVLRILSRMGIMDSQDPSIQYVPTDWKRVNAYLSDSRICGKLLYECNLQELKALAEKLRMIERKERTKQHKLEWLAKNN